MTGGVVLHLLVGQRAPVLIVIVDMISGMIVGSIVIVGMLQGTGVVRQRSHERGRASSVGLMGL